MPPSDEGKRSAVAVVNDSPVACLTAMTFPAILYTTDHLISGAVGLALAVALALKKKSLITVSAAVCLGVFLTEQLMKYL